MNRLNRPESYSSAEGFRMKLEYFLQKNGFKCIIMVVIQKVYHYDLHNNT